MSKQLLTKITAEKRLLDAAEKDDVDGLHVLLDAAQDQIRSDAIGSALVAAAFFGNDRFIEALLGYGCDPNGTDRYGRTALHWAANNGHPRAARLLLEGGAVADQQDSCGDTPVYLAHDNGHQEIADIIADWCSRRNHA